MSRVQRLVDPLVTRFDLQRVRDFVLAVARPSIELIPSTKQEQAGCSKFCGLPDVPGNFVWPSGPDGPHRFLGQFDLSTLPSGEFGSPADGLLSLFFGQDTSKSFYREYLVPSAYHFRDKNELRPAVPPAGTTIPSARVIDLVPGVDVPQRPWCESHGVGWGLSDDDYDSYWNLRRHLHPGKHFLFGYPFNTTLGYDPTPGDGWMSLISLASVDEWDWWWGQGDWFVAFIQADALARGDFTQIRADAG